MKSLPPKSQAVPPEELLRRHERWLRYGTALLILAAGLALACGVAWFQHPNINRVERWRDFPAAWPIVAGLGFLLALAFWAHRRRSLLATARLLDERLCSKNRIEAAESLRNDAGAMARAQRAETGAFLERVSARRAPMPLALPAALVALFFLANLTTFVIWARPGASTTKPAPPPADVPQASIKWISPEAETRAAPIEEVPLEAGIWSSAGLKNLTLEVAVNGTPKPSQDVPASEIAGPGKHTVAVSLYLDQLAVEPFDIVSYSLRAQRVGPEDLPSTVSPVQFVQVRPFRDDVREMPGGDGTSAFPLIVALKSAQLRLVKENFLLAHAEISHESAGWKTENKRVGDEQRILGEKATEVRQRLIDQAMPAEIINLLSQALPAMNEAAASIASTENKKALPQQGKALGLLTSIEKYFIKIAARDGKARGSQNVADPFRDQKEFQLKQRFETRAGELELLQREQARLARDLNKPEPAPAEEPSDDKNRIEGTPAERQTQISQRIGALLNGQVFVPEVLTHLEKARAHAGDSLDRLDAADVPGAREPAALAARELRLAVDAMNRAAEEAARDQLSDTLRALARAAAAAERASEQPTEETAKKAAEAAAQEVAEAKRRLEEAAQKQQETGSEKAAARLEDLARKLSDKELTAALEKWRQQPRNAAASAAAAEKLQALADIAAQPHSGPSTPEELAKLATRMERALTNMRKLAAEATAQGTKSPEDSRSAEANVGSENTHGTSQTPSPSEGSGEKPGEGQGEKEGDKAGEGQGNKPGDQPGNAPSPGEASGSPGEGQSLGTGESKETGVGTGEGSSASEHGSAASEKEQFATELLEEIEQSAREAEMVLPEPTGAKQVIERTRRIRTDRSYTAIISLFHTLERPVDDLIRTLRTEVARQRRQHLIDERSDDDIPAAYRDAVAEYFEQLSRDFHQKEEDPK